jgi:hypothetical protein
VAEAPLTYPAAGPKFFEQFIIEILGRYIGPKGADGCHDEQNQAEGEITADYADEKHKDGSEAGAVQEA